MQIGMFPILNKTNYQVWAIRMHLYLEGLELWDVIESENVPRKDWQEMSIMFNTIIEEITRDLDVDKTTEKTLESLKTKNGGIS